VPERAGSPLSLLLGPIAADRARSGARWCSTAWFREGGSVHQRCQALDRAALRRPLGPAVASRARSSAGHTRWAVRGCLGAALSPLALPSTGSRRLPIAVRTRLRTTASTVVHLPRAAGRAAGVRERGPVPVGAVRYRIVLLPRRTYSAPAGVVKHRAAGAVPMLAGTARSRSCC
jgi:hypothetical protein